MADDGDAAASSDGDRADGVAGRDVVVPLSLYKVVIVFSTLFAIVSVVAGFVALDVATERASAPPSEVDPLLALLGLGLIAAGGVVYAFATRFRAPGMGKAKDGDGEGTDDG